MSNRLIGVLSRCLRCYHLQEWVITIDGVSAVCVNKKCEYAEKL